MSSPEHVIQEPFSGGVVKNGKSEDSGDAAVSSSECARPPSKRRLSTTAAVIEISDTESDDSDICAVTTYKATADEVKRIRGDYSSSSSSSSSSYSSDSDSGCEDESVVIEGGVAGGVCGRGALLLRAGRMDDPMLNPHYKGSEVIDNLAKHWKDGKNYSHKDVTLTCEPFPLCLLHNFLENSEFLHNIVDDMNTLDWSRKKMDLYEFHQTVDLANLTWQRSIRGIYELLKTDVMSWVSKVTGLELTQVSASCSLYGPGDHLLTHDDLLGDRRVAFILYLAPWTPVRRLLENGKREYDNEKAEWCGWSADMGGALELLGSDSAGRPTQVCHSVLPMHNMMALFQVSTRSYHQVAEVTSLELPRLSINGWFHGPAPEAVAEAEPPKEPMPESCKPHTDPVLMAQWLQPTYMSPRARAQVQVQMEQASEVSLHDFLQPDKYKELLDALGDPAIPWELCGPNIQRRYSRVPPVWLESQAETHPVRNIIQMMSATVWMHFLADCTDLTCSSYHSLELQRWSAGDYTLLPPSEHYQVARLEAVLYLGVPDRALCGGSSHYVSPGDSASAALVSLPPRNNALCLVYADAGAARFTAYLSRLTMRPHDNFYILTCSYLE